MTGGSLGLRTPSCGFLQQAQNGLLQCHNILTVRKPSKKERLIAFICRYLGRKKVAMLTLGVLSVLALLVGFISVNKEDASESTSSHIAQTIQHVKSSMRNTVTVCGENNSKHRPIPQSPASVLSSGSFVGHPCEHFAFPPPPPGYRRLIGPRPCPVCYLPVEQAMSRMPGSPSLTPVLRHLTYFREENPIKMEPHGGSEFGGFPSLAQRNDSFTIRESMTVHCGFVKGCRAGYQTGFDIDEADLMELEQFHDVIVASAIFGNYDIIQQPKSVSEIARENVPFYMFIDEETEIYMKNSSGLDSSKRIGLWKIVVVRNLPYADPRRNGKVPKLLLHRLFPNVRYSIWIDGKLQLVADPYQILERFLWRQNATFAISRHYRRFDVFEEAEANKAAGKYNNASIDYQIDFYKREGLTPYSEAKLPITSDVPEGCVIIKEHIPITDLFTCLWFNEVDRFTSRDQLSFSTVRDKIMSKVEWRINMFMDCERRNFVIQGYHRDLLEHMPPPPPPRVRAVDQTRPTFVRNTTAGRIPVKKIPVRRRRRSSRRKRKVTAGNGENN